MNSQSGNVLWIILVAVALIGALTVQLSRSGSSVEKSSGKKEGKIIASEVLRYSAAVEKAVQDLQLRGCGENTISFENDIDSNYTNPNAPADESCHIFTINGAGLSWRSFEGETLDTGASMAITSHIAIFGQNYGTDDTKPDLVIAIPVARATCDEINRQQQISATTAEITSDIDGWDDYFTGSYPLSATWEIGDGNGEASGLVGEDVACLIDDNGQPVLYQVLIGR